MADIDCTTSTESSISSQKPMLPLKISAFTFKTSQAEKKIDKSISRYCYAENVPFNHVENFYLKKMVDAFRSDYEPTNRKSLAEKKTRMRYIKC